MTEYVAFLRGINVGGHMLVPMERLKQAFESLRFTNVQTVLASGNVLFQAPPTAVGTLGKRIEKTLETRLGKKIGVLVRSLDRLQRLAASEPFRDADVSPETRLYVTFLPEGQKATRSTSKSPDGFRILLVTPVRSSARSRQSLDPGPSI